MREAKDILWLDPGHAFGLHNRTSPFIEDNFIQIDQYDFAQTKLDSFKCVVVHDFIDQEYMFKHRDKVLNFLDAGNIVIFAGQLVKEWLPGCPLFSPKKIQSHLDYNISVAKPHAIFENVKTEDMIFNKGVKGFFARGTHSPVPEHAEVLLELPNNVPVTYIDKHTTNGTIFAHAGRDLFAYRNQGKTTDAISKQLLQWIHDEYESLHAKGEV